MSSFHSEQTIQTKEFTNNEGFLTQTTIVQLYTNIPQKGKYAIFAYMTGALLYNFISSYNVGRSALAKCRHDREIQKSSSQSQEKSSSQSQEKSSSSLQNQLSDELDVIKNAISETTYTRFCESLIFPYTIASEIIPKLVLYFNK